MLSTRTGSVSTKAGAGELAAYYSAEQTVASYYGRLGDVRPDLSPAMAERLGLDPTRPATQAEVANLMQGRRADGQDIRGRTRRAGPGQALSISRSAPASRCRSRSLWRPARRNARHSSASTRRP